VRGLRVGVRPTARAFARLQTHNER
jgi:hypothetical protein